MINEVSKKQSRLPVPKFTQLIINIVFTSTNCNHAKGYDYAAVNIYVTSKLTDKKILKMSLKKILVNKYSIMVLGLQKAGYKSQFPEAQLYYRFLIKCFHYMYIFVMWFNWLLINEI